MDRIFVIGATLLPIAVANDVCFELNVEIHKNEWRQQVSGQHHTTDEAPSAPDAPADTSSTTGGSVPAISVGDHITVPGGRFMLESGEGFWLLESGDGYFLQESSDYIVMSI
jgi:hypothetical protein